MIGRGIWYTREGALSMRTLSDIPGESTITAQILRFGTKGGI